jgi:hypothetical protein
MLSAWLPKVLLPVMVALVLALFRRMAPPRARMVSHRYDESQIPERLPSGLIGSAMWSLAIVLALLFFVLRGVNHFWASLEGPSILTQYAPQVIWCFLPGLAAVTILSVPGHALRCGPETSVTSPLRWRWFELSGYVEAVGMW